PHVAVTGHDLERPLRTGAADPDRGMRLLHRLRLGDRVGERVVLPFEARAFLRPEPLDDPDRLPEPPDPLAERREVHPELRELGLVPGGADAELEPAVREV